MRRYPDEVKKFIADNVKGTPVKDLVEMVNAEFGLGFTETKMRSFMKNHGLKNGRPTGNPVGWSRVYPAKIREYIFANHKGVGSKKMAEHLNKTFGTSYTHSQLKGFYGRNKLNSEVTSRFKPGHKPWNTGLKGIQTGGKKTQFKKGNIPANWVPIGTERISKDGYVEIKVQDGKLNKNWKPKHVYIWEQHNGPVPAGHVIIFGDGDNRNFDPENLLCVSRAQLARLNQQRLIKNDVELTKTGLLIADIRNKIAERKRGQKNVYQTVNR